MSDFEYRLLSNLPSFPPNSAWPNKGRNLLARMRQMAVMAQMVYRVTLNPREPASTTKPFSGS